MTLMIAALIVSGIPLQLYHIIIITFELVWSTLVNHYDPFQIIVYFGTLWSLVHIGMNHKYLSNQKELESKTGIV